MIVSFGRKYIFVHIPKTGGTSLALALEARALKDDILIGDTPKARKRRNRLKDMKTAGRLWKHSTLADIHGLVSADDMAQMFTFTLVRNPWDRIVSYYHWLRNQTFDHKAVKLAHDKDFSGFLNDPHTQASIIASPYTRYMQNHSGREMCNAYVRLEHFRDDVAPVEAHLGFEIALPHENLSQRHRDYSIYYSKADKILVERLCRSDNLRFGYRFCDAA